MSTPTYVHPVTIYYEDTDHSGLVYHANYLKYFERAREHVLGREELVRLLEQEGVGFVVYRAELTYRRGAQFGDVVEVRTSVTMTSEYRLAFVQNVHRRPDGEQLVAGHVDLVTVDRNRQLIPLPASVLARLQASPR
ncbi:MAG: YbgC/FadM family acyl-CoA thioesterase [Myxococcota bacterium]